MSVKAFAFLGCALFYLISGSLCFFSCSQGAKQQSKLEIAIRTQPITLDPRTATDAYGQQISELIFNGLFNNNERMEIVPDLAAHVEQPNDTTYVISLKKGVFFHHGKELTADDVIYTITSMRDGGVISPHKSVFARIKTLEKIDPYTIRLELTEPFAPLLISLCVGIVPQDVAQQKGESFGREPIGTGPYRFVRWMDDTVVELAAHEKFSGQKPLSQKLLFQIVKDDNVRVLKLLKGDLDIVLNGVPPLLLEKVKEDKKLVTRTETGLTMAYIGVNMTDNILKKKNVRKAIALGLNRDELIQHRRYGLAEKANSLLAPVNWAFDKRLSQIPYDPEQAKKLLNEAGYHDPDGDGPKMRFTLSFKTSTVKERVDTVRMIAHQLGKIGVGIKVESFEWATLFDDIKKGNFQLYSLTWVGIIDPDMYYSVFHSTQTPPEGANRGRYKNPALDPLLEAGRREINIEKRGEIYANVQEILLDDLPQIPLWHEDNILVYRKGLEHVALWPDASFQPLASISTK